MTSVVLACWNLTFIDMSVMYNLTGFALICDTVGYGRVQSGSGLVITCL